MTLPANYVNPTGKSNALISLQKWLESNVLSSGPADLVWVFTATSGTVAFPRVEVAEFNDPSIEPAALGDYVFPAAATLSPAMPTDGRWAHMRVVFDIYASESSTANPKALVYNIRDRIKHALEVAGKSDDNLNVLLPPIELMDYLDNPSSPNDTGQVLVPDLHQASILERYFGPSVDAPGVHQFQLLIKLSWFEMTN